MDFSEILRTVKNQCHDEWRVVYPFRQSRFAWLQNTFQGIIESISHTYVSGRLKLEYSIFIHSLIRFKLDKSFPISSHMISHRGHIYTGCYIYIN